MKNVSVSQAAVMWGGELINCKNPDTELTSVCIDSRLAFGGSVFAAFKGVEVIVPYEFQSFLIKRIVLHI